MSIKDMIYIIVIVLVHFCIGRILVYSSSLHAYQIPKQWRQVLFIVDVRIPATALQQSYGKSFFI